MALYTLVMTHITIVAVTVYLHRYSAHRSLELNGALKHFFRFWLWLTTGMLTKEWTAVHRKHHAHCETEEDPHSPQIFGLRKVLFEGAELYGVTAAKPEVLERFGKGTPDDWIERNLYSRFKISGVGTMMVIDLLLFGVGGSDDLGHPDAVDSVFCRGRHQRRRPLLGLPQLRVSGRGAQPRAVGHPDRRRRAAQQSPHLPELRETVGEAVGVRHRLDVDHAVQHAGSGAAVEHGTDRRKSRRQRPDRQGHRLGRSQRSLPRDGELRRTRRRPDGGTRSSARRRGDASAAQTRQIAADARRHAGR